MDKLKVGDVVALKSGSIPMTVTGIGIDNKSCQVSWWVDGNTHFGRASLSVDCLVLCTEIKHA